MINLNDLLKSANGQLFGEAVAQLFTDFCFDASNAKPSQLFVALRTAHGDTHYAIAEAIKNGVSGILCHEPPVEDTTNLTVIIVKNSLDTLLMWSRYVLGRMGAKVVAVIGSSGQSVAARALTTVLSKKFTVQEGDLDTEGLLNIPRSVARLQPEAQYVIMKLSPTTPNEMAEMLQACQPTTVVLNHVDSVAMMAFKDVGQLLQEYALALNSLSPNDLVVLNFDDDKARELSSRTRAQVKTVGIDNFGADMMAMNIVVGVERTGFDVRYSSEKYVGRWSPLLGKHQLYGALSALMVGVHLDIPIEDCLRALSQVSAIPGRMNPLVGKNDCMLVDDTYHANLYSTLSLLDWIKDVKAERQRTIFVMGDLDNLGTNSQYAYRTIGARAAEVSDYIVTLGTEASIVGRSAIDKEMPPKQIITTYGIQDAIRALQELNLTADDVVVVKGGNSSRLESVVKRLLKDPNDSVKLVRQDDSTFVDIPIRTLRPSWKEIDGDALAKNIRAIRATLASDVTMMAVVKSNGYGHGAIVTARTALASGANYIGVANMAEALELRDAGITAPILVLTYLPIHAVRQAISENITATVYDLNSAQQYDRAARSANGRLKVHVKIDSGMGRLGILVDDAVTVFRYFNALNFLEIEGLYTHFATADENAEFAMQQYEKFRSTLRVLRAGGFQFKYVHAANSPATLLNVDFHFTMVRTGVMMYGLQASSLKPVPEEVTPVMSWKTTVLQVKTVPKGHGVGYGRSYITDSQRIIAVLPIGYADGLRRSPKTWKEVLIHGRRAPLIGRVSMEKCVVDVTDIHGVSSGDEVVLLGKQGTDRITAEEIGEWLGTINYEVTTTILPREV
jgi:Alr-MurF fusion protein